MLAAALAHHRAGRLHDAEQIYRRILTIDRRHADSWHLLGLIAHARGQHDLAASSIRKAIAINGRAAAYHFSLGNALVSLDRCDAAIACYRRTLDLHPDFPDAHGNFGNALRQLGRLAEAVDCYRRAVELTPRSADLLNNLGITLRQHGQLADAVACFRRALDLNPEFPAAHNNLGNALRHEGRLDEAAACYRRALALDPDYADAHANLGGVLEAQGGVDEAVALLRHALTLRPDHPEAHNNLGNALKAQGHLAAAVACFRQALHLRPDYDEAQYNLGNVLRAQGDLEAAVDCFRQALVLRPDFADAHVNLGNTLAEQRRLDEAMACYRHAIALQPDQPDAHFNLGIVLLTCGDLMAGWREYEWRWRMPHMRAACRDMSKPQWYGEAAEGRTLLIHAEQGFGDTLQFCRYVRLAAERGLRVILQVPQPLVRLLRGVAGVELAGVELVVACGGDPPPFDLHCPMLSLPLVFGTTLATIPQGAAYLHADPRQVEGWQARLGGMPGRALRVGVVWAGDPRTHSPALAAVDRRRSLAPDRLAPLFDVPGVDWFSLQKTGPAPPAELRLTDLMHEMADFADTAALIANLDLVIAVDTAVAHLAAALGRPVWLLDRFDSCWRWLTDRRDSPWYPTLRLYRQPRAGDWDAVLTEVARDLRIIAEA